MTPAKGRATPGLQPLQYNYFRAFLSRDAAFAFKAGVEYVNDSSIRVVAIRDIPGGDFIVYCLDDDSRKRHRNVLFGNRLPLEDDSDG